MNKGSMITIILLLAFAGSLRCAEIGAGPGNGAVVSKKPVNPWRQALLAMQACTEEDEIYFELHNASPVVHVAKSYENGVRAERQAQNAIKKLIMQDDETQIKFSRMARNARRAVLLPTALRLLICEYVQPRRFDSPNLREEMVKKVCKRYDSEFLLQWTVRDCKVTNDSVILNIVSSFGGASVPLYLAFKARCRLSDLHCTEIEMLDCQKSSWEKMPPIQLTDGGCLDFTTTPDLGSPIIHLPNTQYVCDHIFGNQKDFENNPLRLLLPPTPSAAAAAASLGAGAEQKEDGNGGN